MPTKTDRILSYLPQTFQTSPRPLVLYPVADAFGNELLLGENCLAAIMLAHWVDFADKNELKINDLGKMAALYGLAPWLDESGESLESVEEFREHLKRYVRTFLEGTVTVQGILRVAAEALSLRIAADAPEQLDRWWTRKQDALSDVVALGSDATAQLNFDHASASGSSALAAQVTGSVDLSEGITLQGANMLRLKVDGSFEEIDLADGNDPKGPFALQQIVDVINRAPRPTIASHDGHYLTLAAPTTGPTSKLEVVNGADDAAPRLLGLPPRSYHGVAATAAQFKGTVDLSSPIDLSNNRYLRIEIDAEFQKEIDCADTDEAHTSLIHIRDAINNAFPGLNVASDDGKHLILTSPTKGIGSSISVQPPAAQNAALQILGVPSLFEAGLDAQPARAESNRDLRGTIDLSKQSRIRLRIDGAAAVTINCAGAEPKKTERVEIVAAINDELNAVVGVITERSISLVSPTAGPASEIVFETAGADDATFQLFGIGPLTFQGSAPTVALLTASPSLTDNGLDVRANNFLVLGVDGSTPVEIDMGQAAPNHAELMSLPLTRLAEHINKSFAGVPIASTDGKKLFLTSPRTGGGSKLEVLPRETLRQRRFVTRAIVTDEAARDVFGFFGKESQGTSPVRARLIGAPDLSLSVDLKVTRFLRLRVDGRAAIEIDCAGDRPRATTLEEVVGKINAAFSPTGTQTLATHDGKHLLLISPTLGSSSRLVIEPPRVALEKLLGVEPGTFHGAFPTAVRFTSTVNLTGGIDLPAGATIKLGIDDVVPFEIVLGEAAPVHRSVSDITNAINSAFTAPVASTDGRRIVLSSAKTGANSKVIFEAASANDVTQEIFGIVAPREYHGAEASPARVVGQKDLSGTNDLSVFRFLRIAIDGAPAQTIDCAVKAAKPEAATLDEIVNSIGPDIASASSDGKNLILTSPSVGPTSQIALETFNEGDASKALFGNNPLEDSGKPALPAVIIGEKSLLSSIDLSRRSLLRVAVDDRRAIDIDVAGAVPAKTALDEIVTRINDVYPNLAAANSDDQLQLTSTTAGPASKLSLQPMRFLEVVEYPRVAATPEVREGKHHDSWTVFNDGVADSEAEIRILAPQGTVGPGVANSGLEWSVHLFEVLERGETARLFRDPRLGFQAEVIALDGTRRRVPESQILVGPLGSQAWVPFQKEWTVSGERSLQLNNPQAFRIAVLKGLKPENEVDVSVLESDISSLPTPAIQASGKTERLVGRLRTYDKGFRLVDANEAAIADVLAGPYIDLGDFLDKVVQVEGTIYSDATPLMLARRIAALFDVTLSCTPKDRPPVKEAYRSVTIGAGTTEEDSLVLQINAGSQTVPTSELVRGDELDKALVLNLPQGKTRFSYLDCLGSRFDDAYFDEARFAGGCFNTNHVAGPPVPCCSERGIFDVSRFSNAPPEKIGAVFSAPEPFSEPPVTIDFRWEEFSAGSFTVNLPADLPARFGARFNDARFGQDKDPPADPDKDSPDNYKGAVAEPENDPRFLIKLMSPESGNESNFVNATLVRTVELGWTPALMPFRKPQFLTLGGRDRAARLYLSEEGLAGFIRLEAKDVGAWGNEISVSARQAGPAIYDVSIIYRGGRFEQATSIVMGAARETIQEFLKPGPTGVLQAKAAGVRADVTRERAESDQLTTTT
jgi:hypothetical protein